MSTKTTFKRVALVAVSALGIGLISAVPSVQASVIGVPTVTTTNGTATLQKSDSTTGASLSVQFSSDRSGDSVAVTVTLGSKPSGAVGGTDSLLASAVDTTSTTGAINKLSLSDNAGLTATWTGADSKTVNSNAQIISGQGQGNVYGKFKYHLDSSLVRTAGTYTFDYVVKVYSASTASDGAVVATSAKFGQFTIVVTDGTAAATGAVSAAGTSTAIMYGGSSYVNTGSVDSVVSAVNTPSSTTPIAVIRVTQKTAAGDPSTESITVTTNVGNVGTTSSATGKSVTFVASTNGVDDIGIFPDGTGGIATITIKTTSVTFANKQVTFYGGTVAKIDAVMLANTLGGSAQNIILAKAYDAGNNQVLGDTVVYAYSSNTSVVNTGTSPAGTACTYSASYGGQLCSLAGSSNGTATFTLRNASTSSASTVASTATLSVTVNTNAAAAIKLALNKSTYAPGEVAYLSVWAVDAAGNAVGNGTYTNLLATGGITSTVAVGNNSDATTSVSPALAVRQKAVDGIDSLENVKVYKVYMPYTGGDISFEATGGTLLPTSGQVKVTVKASVTDNGAAALAAVTALASQVSAFITKINAQITTLTDLVMKIQKKVKA